MATTTSRRRVPARARHRPLVAAAAVAGLLAGGCAAPGEDRSAAGPAAVVQRTDPDDGYHGVVLDRPYALPDLAFTDTAGEPYRPSEDATAPVTLVFFGYTHCPDVCNAVLSDVASALRRADPAVRDAVELVFVTTDPARDTPERIREYLDRFDPAFEGLTAPLPVVEEAAEGLGVGLTGTSELPGGGYEVGHGTQLIGFGPDRAGRLVWTQPTPVGDLREDLTQLAGGA